MDGLLFDLRQPMRGRRGDRADAVTTIARSCCGAPSVSSPCLRSAGMIALIGPGGAGKSTAGQRLAERLEIPFVDLDRRFNVRAGDISAFIQRHGYAAYARENVEAFVAVLDEIPGDVVVALSSGFMTYPRDSSPHYVRVRQRIDESATTFVLLPSLDAETCVAETVRRQMRRPFARSAAMEEAMIRERFSFYSRLRARKVATMRPTGDIVAELLMALRIAPSGRP